MKRRQFIKFAGIAGISTLLAPKTSFSAPSPRPTPNSQPNPNAINIQWMGHTCFLMTGGGIKVLVNPFRSIGCTEKYQRPSAQVDVVLASSRLNDEGWLGQWVNIQTPNQFPTTPRIFVQAGAYQFSNITFQGVGIAHDRENGRRFGQNVAWRWIQGGVNMVHLGGACANIELEQKILLANPDILFVPVGGGVKAYNPQEAKQAVDSLNPKVVIPMHYKSSANSASCELSTVDEFLGLLSGYTVTRFNSNQHSLLKKDIPSDKKVVWVFDDRSRINP